MSEQTSINAPNSRQLIWDVAALALPLLGLAPMLLIHARGLWAKPETTLLLCCWIALASISYLERKSFAKSRQRVLLSYVSLAIAFVVGLASVIYFSPWAANLAMGFVFLGWALIRFVPGTVSRILAMSTLAFLPLNLPFGLDAKLTSWLNETVVQLTSAALDLFGVYHLYQSPYLALKDHYFEVADLFASIFSLQSMVAIAIIVSVSWGRPLLTSLFTILSAMAWTLLGKILFLFTTAVFSFNGINITESILGTFLVLAFFLMFLLLLLSTDAFWNSILSPIRAGDEGVYRSSTADMFNKLVVWPGKLEFEDRSGRAPRAAKIESTLNIQPGVIIAFGIAMAIFALPTLVAIVRNDLLLNRANYLAIPYDRIPEAKSLPDDFIAKQRQRQFRVLANSGIYGGSSKTLVWNYGGSGVDTLILLRFPVRGWVKDTAYSLQGLTPVESTMKNDASNWPWSESILEGENGRAGLVFSSQLHTKGDPYVPTPDEMKADEKIESKGSRLFNPLILEMLNPKQETIKPQTFAIQLRFQSETSIRPAEKQMLLEKFLEARKILTNRLLGKETQAKP